MNIISIVNWLVAAYRVRATCENKIELDVLIESKIISFNEEQMIPSLTQED